MTNWVFGYGSVVWRPSFEYEARVPGVVDGWVRRFWQGSPDHRGTAVAPGRVATMLRWPGQRCRGMAYRLSGDSIAAVLAKLDDREVAGYQRESVSVSLDGDEVVDAVTWVATPSNPNFLGMAPPAEMAAQIHRCVGASGRNREYVLKLAEALRGLGEDGTDQTFELERLLLELEPDPRT